jgi:hypothetical protein
MGTAFRQQAGAVLDCLAKVPAGPEVFLEAARVLLEQQAGEVVRVGTQVRTELT